MRRSNVFGSIFLCLMLCFLLTSCGAEKLIEETGQEYVYVPYFYEYNTEYSWVSCVVPMGEELLVNETGYFNRPISKQKTINPANGESCDFKLELLAERYVADIISTTQGYVIYSEEYVHDSSFMEEYEIYTVAASYIGYFDKSFRLQREVDITDFVMDKSSFSQVCEEILVDDEENIYFLYMDKIFVLDKEGKLLSEIVPNATDVLDIAYVDKKVLVLYMDKGRNLQIASIHPEEYRLENLLWDLPDIGYSASLFAGEEETLYLAGDNFLYRYDTDAGEWTAELKWLDCDLDGLGLHHLLPMDGQIICLKYRNSCYEISVLQRTPVSQVKERELVTVTMLKKDYYLLEQVSEYNRKQKDIRLESKYYVEEESKEALEEGLLAFQMDLISGEVGDILFVSREMDFLNLASKGAFAGLDDFLEKDIVLSKEDLLPCITEIFSVDDCLYGFVPKFSMMTMIGKTSEVGEGFSWTVEDMATLHTKRNMATLMPNATKQDGLRTILSGSMASYYDISTGKCSFDGEEFKKLLALMNTLPEKLEEYSDNFKALAEGTALVDSVFFFDGTDLRGYRTLMGEDISFIGYPNSEGFGTVVNVGNGVYTISAASGHKEAAWQFLRGFLLAEYQEAVEYSFPVTRSALESYLYEEMNRVYSENYTHNFYGVTLENEPMSEEDAEYICQLIAGIKEDNSYDLRLMNLILEEAEGYFSGQKTLEEVVNIIQNRAQLYVDENM